MLKTWTGSLQDDHHRLPFTMVEYEEWRSFTTFPWDALRRRETDGWLARGRALVAPLLKACADAGVTLVTGAPVVRLARQDERVSGVRVAGGREVSATNAVILATGGFEWNPEMVVSFLRGPLDATCATPHNTGDGIRMAMKAGAAIANMQEAWWFPMLRVARDEVDGRPAGTLVRFERTGPHTIIVNRAGRRFVNEAHNYNDMTRAFHTFDPKAYTYTNLPAHLVFDHRHLEKYGFLEHRAGQPTPAWLTEGRTLEDLAHAVGIDAGGLTATVERFNAHARLGQDPDFGRGESAYDRYWGDAQAEHPALGPLETPPFYAVEIVSGAIGTKGGIVTDPSARALDPFGEPIPGLFAAGNTTAHPMGPGYPGAGGTLGRVHDGLPGRPHMRPGVPRGLGRRRRLIDQQIAATSKLTLVRNGVILLSPNGTRRVDSTKIRGPPRRCTSTSAATSSGLDAVSTRGVAKTAQRSRSSGTFEPVGPVLNVMS